MGLQVDNELIERLEKGVDLINDQHKRIFDFTTDLFAHCVGEDEEENEYFGMVIGGAVGLVTTHFKTEEKLMLDTKFDVFEFIEHKKEHDEFVATVGEYVSQFEKTKSIDLLTFASYAKWWVIGHIKRHDKKYVTHFNKIGEGYGIKKMNV